MLEQIPQCDILLLSTLATLIKKDIKLLKDHNDRLDKIIERLKKKEGK